MQDHCRGLPGTTPHAEMGAAHGEAMTTKYAKISEQDVPAGVRFDVPARHQGQMKEVAYGGTRRDVHDEGDEYKCVTDRSDGSVTYYRREQ